MGAVVVTMAVLLIPGDRKNNAPSGIQDCSYSNPPKIHLASGTRSRSCHSQCCGSCSPRLNQSRICPVGSTLSSACPWGRSSARAVILLRFVDTDARLLSRGRVVASSKSVPMRSTYTFSCDTMEPCADFGDLEHSSTRGGSRHEGGHPKRHTEFSNGRR